MISVITYTIDFAIVGRRLRNCGTIHLIQLCKGPLDDATYHNLNNFGRGPLDNVLYWLWKLWTLQYLTRIFFYQNPNSGSGEEVVWCFPYIFNIILWPPGLGQFWHQGHYLNNFGKGPLDMMLYTKYESSGPFSIGWADCWKLHFENLLLTPWPTYATNWNGLNNFDRGPPRDHSCEVWSKSIERFQSRCLSKQEGPEGPGSLTWGKGQRSQCSQ